MKEREIMKDNDLENDIQNRKKIVKENRKYLLKRFVLQFVLFFILFSLVLAKNAGDLFVAAVVSVVVSLGLLFGEANSLRHYAVSVPEPGIKIVWKKDGILFLGIWVLFTAGTYFLRKMPNFSAAFLALDLVGSGVAAGVALYLRRTGIKF